MAYHEYNKDGKLVQRHYNGLRLGCSEEMKNILYVQADSEAEEEMMHLKAVKLLNDLQEYLGDALYQAWCDQTFDEDDSWARIYWIARDAWLRKEAVKEKLNAIP